MRWTVRPLSDVTGFDGGRQESAFTTSWSDALTLLDRELSMLKARDVVLELDVREDQIRLDGGLRGGSRPASGRVRLAFDSRHGQLVYATNRFWRGSGARFKMRDDWQHNVYAIAKALEALRLVDRYGVTSGQQYTGFKALPAGRAMPSSHMTRTAAAELLERIAIGDDGASRERTLARILNDAAHAREVWRHARREVHPDRRDGDRTMWDQVEQAADVLGVAS